MYFNLCTINSTSYYPIFIFIFSQSNKCSTCFFCVFFYPVLPLIIFIYVNIGKHKNRLPIGLGSYTTIIQPHFIISNWIRIPQIFDAGLVNYNNIINKNMIIEIKFSNLPSLCATQTNSRKIIWNFVIVMKMDQSLQTFVSCLHIPSTPSTCITKP